MKFTGHVIIQKPRALVAELFLNPGNLHAFQDGFQKKVLISGEPGQVGAVSKMYYRYGKRQLELKETITRNELPEVFQAFYEHQDMDNTMVCRFIPLNDQSTRFEYEFEYTRVSWFMPKLMFLLFPGMFRKQGEKWMHQFRDFAEKQSQTIHFHNKELM